MGCVAAELLFNTENMCKDQDEKYLFPGSSCFPLSPSSRMKLSNSFSTMVSRSD
jgi:hypothetical protein